MSPTSSNDSALKMLPTKVRSWLADRLDRRYVKRSEYDRLATRLAAQTAREPDRARPHVRLGEACSIDPYVTMWARADAPISVGSHTKIYRGGEFQGPVTIGAKTFINRDVYVRAGAVIGNDCSIGPFVRIITDTHEMGPARHRAGKLTVLPVSIQDGCWIGAGVIVLPGVTIGAGSVVAAGAVVVSDVPPNTLVGGIPARPIRSLDG